MAGPFPGPQSKGLLSPGPGLNIGSDPVLSKSIKKRWRYVRGIGLFEALVFMVSQLFHVKRDRLVRVAGAPLWLRTATPDLDVALSCFANAEYDHIVTKDTRWIIDAGANIGTAARFFSGKFPEATILAIEPETDNMRMLLKNIEGHPRIIPVQAALWSEETTLDIKDRGTGPWGYTVMETARDARPIGQKTTTVTIPVLMAKYRMPFIDILKMDIEGAEATVLASPGDWIPQVRVLTVELHKRIAPNCAKVFHAAVQSFATLKKHGEKITAYRDSADS